MTTDGKNAEGSQRKRLAFVEYNLSELKDTKGGFILSQEDISSSNNQYNSNQRKRVKPAILYEHLQGQQECFECGSSNINTRYLSVYKFSICNECVDFMPDKYSLLTKTECRTDYLLTDEELESLPYMERQNPHKSSYSRMKLYLRCQVEKFALEKWKSWEELDKEYERRVKMKEASKNRKFKEKLKDLRRRTMTANIKHVPTTLQHEHTFVSDESSSGSGQKCSECGFTIEVEDI